MKAVLISGLWPTKEENGLISLGDQIKALGHEVQILHYDSKDIPEADIYIGHSLGAMRCEQIIKSIGMPVKYFAAIDYVNSDWFPFFFWNANKHFTVSSNVMKADCFKRKGAFIPPSSKILNPEISMMLTSLPPIPVYKYANYDVDTSHADAPRNSFIVETILSSIKSIL